MTFAIIVLGLALAISLAFNFGVLGGSSATPSLAAPSNSPRETSDDAPRSPKLEAELDKRRKELDELKKTHAELKAELKEAKKKIFDAKEADKAGDDLTKARAEVERQASIQLETTRSELATALADLQRLRAEAEGKGARRPKPTNGASPNAEEVDAKPAQPKQEVVVQRVIRELSEAEKEKMQRLELQASQDKKKAIELAAELRSIKGRIDREKREAKRIYEEGRLSRDKFRAVEIRLNRTLLENDLLKRAITDLEKKTGSTAERLSLTTDELAQSDASVTAKHVAEDKASADALAKLEAAEAVAEAAATAPDTTPPPEATAAAAAATTSAPAV